ncbi:MAG: hypothetical protein U0797_02340 [Gemmataceae bacterium]
MTSPHPTELDLAPDPDAVAGPGSLRSRGWAARLFVALFALFLASFPARNSDLLLYLAAGRDLAQGLAGPTPTWMFDLGCYVVFTLAGGAGLVFAKALVVVVTALLVLQLSRTEEGWAIPAACTALALLAMGLRLLLQPATASLLFLALTLTLLRGRQRGDGRSPALGPWPLVLLFAAWANVDPWFLLGLGTVALAWLGQALDERPVGRGLMRHAGALALLAAACLLNPYHAHAFASAQALLGIGPPEEGRLVTSPFQEAYWAGVGLNPAGLAYFPLLGLGALSFLGNARGWKWSWFLPWAGLALLSAWQVRAVPFFAVVAGPLLARNLQEALRRRGVRGGKWVPTRVLAAALLLCAWPGWLQAPPYGPRAWGLDLPPSLRRGAEALATQRAQGTQLGRGLHLSAETARAFSWYAPGEAGLLDDRLVRGALGDPAETAGWAERMRAAGVGHLVVYDTDRARLVATLDRLLGEPETWAPLVLEGDLVAFGWRQSAAGDPYRGREVDLDRLAFRPEADRLAPADGPAARRGPAPWWEAFWRASPRRAIDRDEATLFLLYAEALRRFSPHRRLAAWEVGQAAGLAAAGGGWPAAPVALADACWRLVLVRPPLPEEGPPPPLSRVALSGQQGFALEQDDCPPALLYLAVRAARRAVAATPDDSRAYQVMGEAYLRLLRDTRERVWVRRMPELGQLRRAQASAALNRAVALDPTLAEAHAGLAELYRETGYLDLALRHLQAARRLGRQEPGTPLGGEAGRLAEAVAAAEAEFEDKAGKSLVLERATAAFRVGLAGRARDLLLESDLAAFGPQGMALELELLLRTGRERDLLDWLSPEQRPSLGGARYHWLRVQALAAAGEYALAEEECEALAAERQNRKTTPPVQVMGMLVGQAILDGQGAAACWPDLAWRAVGRVTFSNRVNDLVATLRQQAKADIFRGMLALERGDVGPARDALTQALSLWAGGDGIDFLHRPVAEGYLQLLHGSRP